MPKSLKAASVNFKDLHLLDHIAPLSYILKIPLYIETEKNYSRTKKYYPNVNAKLQTPIDFISLVQKHNTLFECKFWVDSEICKTFFNEKIKFLFCPH